MIVVISLILIFAQEPGSNDCPGKIIKFDHQAKEHGISSLTRQLGEISGVAVAAVYDRVIVNRKAYLRIPSQQALKSVGLEKGSSVTGPYLLHRSQERGANRCRCIRVAAEHLTKIQ